MYVLGMVAPLLFISAFLGGKVPQMVILRRPISSLKIFGKEYSIILSNLIAGIIFFITGSLTLLLARTGVLSIARSEQFSKIIQNAGGAVNALIGGNFLLDVIFLGVVAYIIYRIARMV